MLLTLAAFVLVLGVLILVHELGHFMAAKAVGIAVPRFSIGLGPATPLRFQRGETEYQISWLPLGGYVKMASLEEQEAMESLEGGAVEQKFPPENLFESKSLLARILVISAGVIMNVLFAWGAYTALFAIYGRAEDPTTAIARVDATVLPEAAAELAAVASGARIESVNGEAVTSWGAILKGVMDPETPRLRFDFADAAPVILEVPGSDAEARRGIARALIPLWEPRIASVASGRPAAEAGMEAGDLLTAVDGTQVRSWDGLVRALEPSAGKTLEITWRRGDVEIEESVVPAEVEVKDPRTGEIRKVGRIGISGPQLQANWVEVSLAAAITDGLLETGDNAMLILGFVKGLILGQVSLREVGGPVMIGQVSGQAARAGGPALLALMAFLSVNLAILNLLPIPALDGGHLVFLVAEGLRGGKPLSQDLRRRLTMIGIYGLLGLMAFVLINDVLRLVGGS